MGPLLAGVSCAATALAIAGVLVGDVSGRGFLISLAMVFAFGAGIAAGQDLDL